MLVAARRVVAAAPKLARSGSYTSNVISGPPQTKVSFAEKAATGVFMAVATMVVPMYVLVNIKEYTKGH